MSLFAGICVAIPSALAAAGIATVLYLYISFRRGYTFWRDRNVTYLEPSFPMGNTQDSVYKQLHFAHISRNLYQRLKRLGSTDYGGTFVFKRPNLFVLSPEFAKTVLVRDFASFVDRGMYHNERDDPLSGNLFFIEGDAWRRLRAKISPTFTSGKMKLMFHTIRGVADRLTELLATIVTTGGGGVGGDGDVVDVREYLARFTTDVIGSCAFGIECDSIRDPDSEFRQMGKKMFSFTKLQSLKLMLMWLMPDLAQRWRMQFNTNEVTAFVMQLVRRTIAQRRQSGERRNDFMQLMMDMHAKDGFADDEDGLSLEEIAAQSFIFFFAGFETSSTTMTYALYELALNVDIQQHLRDEINECCTTDGGSLTYENIQLMPYLDRVVCGEYGIVGRILLCELFRHLNRVLFAETLRKYPIVATLHRITNADYVLPNGAIMDRGTFVTVPTYAFHHDAELYPQPEIFDPDRFADEAKAKRHPYAYLPFGEGPRVCIGMRFGMLQTKLGLAALLRRFRFEVCAKTEVPIVVDQVNMLYAPLGGVYLKVTAC